MIDSLDLSHNEFREQGGILIGDALGSSFIYICELNVLFTLVFLFSCIAANEDLEELNLSWNHLRGKGAECLAMGLAVSKKVVHDVTTIT